MSTNKRAVHVATIKREYKGKTYVTHLLRHTFREDGKVKHLTVGNLSDLPDDLIEVIRRRLAGGPLPAEDDDFGIVRSLPHGHVAAVLGTLQKIGLDRLIASKPCRYCLTTTSARWRKRRVNPSSRRASFGGRQAEGAKASHGGWISCTELSMFAEGLGDVV